MKAVFSCNPKRIINGLSSAIQCCSDIECILWLPTSKPVMDMFDEVSPDLFFCDSDFFSQELEIALQNNPQTRFISIGNANGFSINPHLAIGNSGTDKFPEIPASPAANLAQINRGSYDEKLACDVICITNNINHDKTVQMILNYLSHTNSLKLI